MKQILAVIRFGLSSIRSGAVEESAPDETKIVPGRTPMKKFLMTATAVLALTATAQTAAAVSSQLLSP